MNRASHDILTVWAVVAALIASIEAPAQDRLSPPNMPQPDVEGRPDPTQDPRSTGSIRGSDEPLSDKLDKSGGVIRPPANIAPNMAVRPPDPDPGTTRVIPPPGTPGGDPTLVPK
jgi:hypothetical protein